MRYTSRSMRRMKNGDTWEVSLSHKDPLTGKMLRSYHYVHAATEKQAAKERDKLILELERKGASATSGMTLKEFMDKFLAYKEDSGTIEPSTIRSYRSEQRTICKYIGDVRLADLSIPIVNGWMADMQKEGYAPKSVTKPFRLLKQALKWAVAQDLTERKATCRAIEIK